MPLENTLAMTSVLELRMRRWLSGWSTPVLEAPTVQRQKHQYVMELNLLQDPLLLQLSHVRVAKGNNWTLEDVVAGLTWIAKEAVSTYARYDNIKRLYFLHQETEYLKLFVGNLAFVTFTFSRKFLHFLDTHFSCLNI